MLLVSAMPSGGVLCVGVLALDRFYSGDVAIVIRGVVGSIPNFLVHVMFSSRGITDPQIIVSGITCSVLAACSVASDICTVLAA
jgi:hypothetical protein